MNPATRPRDRRDDVRLLAIDRHSGETLDGAVEDLRGLLRPGDLLVVNDAATLPASLRGVAPGGESIEVRLAGSDGGGRWRAVIFGAGDWRTPTEERGAAPLLGVGDRLLFGDDGEPLRARIVAVDPRHRRLVELEFEADDEELWAGLYRLGAPIQYAYLEGELDLWSVQSVFAGPPWAVEMPSAGRPLSWGVIQGLLVQGIEVARVTHAAGLSSTGDPSLDRLLPLPERYAIPPSTVAAIRRTKAAGGRVIAVGTTVIRALEGSFVRHGELRPGEGVTELLLSEETELAIVDGVITGMHGPGESHRHLLEAFASPALLDRAWTHAVEAGYLAHELGDIALLADFDPGALRSESAPERERARCGEVSQ